MNRALVRSMTGYGEGEATSGRSRIRAEIRTVNHRHLNVQFRTPSGFERHHRAMERVLKEHLARGHATVQVTVEPADASGAAAVAIDLDRARAYVRALAGMKEELGLEGEVTLPLLAGLRDLYRTDDVPPPDAVEEADLLEAIAGAARRTRETREAEGARLATDMEGRLEVMERELDAIEARAPARLVEERDRLRTRIDELLEGRAELDEERIHREVAHLAERWDIHEELVRFRSHLRMFRDALASGDPGGVGKRLGFVAQELLREANTIGSKANDAEIAGRVVVLKEEIDRLREQVENVE